jgi:arylsulfatase A-like enzyme
MLAVIVAFTFACGPTTLLFPETAAARPMPPAPQSGAKAGGDCDLKSATGEIKHVIYIQFDNVHLTRDNPNVPSDLEQMPNLLNFLKDDGALITHEHTPLKSHTADDIITSLTGVYGDRHGIAVANSFGWFNPPGSKFFDGFASSFQYWTDIVSPSTDPSFFMVTPQGKTAPAPWVPWTRAGCNVGAVSTANIELENVFGDIATVFASDPTRLAQAQNEVNNNFYQAVADYEGIAIHCAAGNAVCSSANGGEPDLLPEEPNGYNGFNALYGHKFVAPVISPGGPLLDLDGIVVNDDNGEVGFPGFGGISAAQSLAYVAAMQEHGVPVTYAYIADVHDNHSGENADEPAECLTDPEQGALGPGDACYVAQLAAYNDAFGKFFERLKADGITKENTLFVITADEGDHFAGGAPTPANCDGLTVTCSYAKLGEIDSNIQTLLDNQDPSLASTQIDIQYDMAPVFYIDGNPAPGAPLARSFERATAQLTTVSPITGNTDQLTRYLADPVELKLLHMITGDPQRTPTYVMFGDPDYYFQLSGPVAIEDSGFAWNHGGVDHAINRTWLGLVGPGVKNVGQDDDTWSDHTDIRPTMLVLAGLEDDYSHEGRALVEELHSWALPNGVSGDQEAFTELARSYKKINAPVGPLALASLRISTRALASGDATNDSTYNNLETQLSIITSLRDDLASRMEQRLENAEFHNQPVHGWEALAFSAEAQALLDYTEAVAQAK